tara:strand:- start:16 stop:258 length:243 start_codon:yes stop_codon:yes gene_type:complete
MITIKKGDLKIELTKNSFVSAQDTSDGLFFRLKDGTEIRLNVPLTPQLKVIPTMIMGAKTKHVNVDLDNVMQPISFTNDD